MTQRPPGPDGASAPPLRGGPTTTVTAGDGTPLADPAERPRRGPSGSRPAPPRPRRPERWGNLGVHLATLVVAGLVLAWANRGQWFAGDEWEFIVNRGFDSPRLSLWFPHNEHWSTLPILVYTALRDTVGLHSYWPYIGVLILIHLTLTHLLWRICRRTGLPAVVATAGCAVFAVYGAGAENLLWAFQIGFVGSLAFGWGAALLADRAGGFDPRRDGLTVLLLIGSLMCSGIGVPAVVLVSVLALARARSLLRPVVVGGVPAVVFVLWWLLVGRQPAPPWPAPADDGPWALITYVATALRDTLAAGTGLPDVAATVVTVALAGWAVWQIAGLIGGMPRFTASAPALAGLLAAVAFFTISGFGRGQTDASRYVYVASALALPAVLLALWQLASLLGRRIGELVIVLVLLPVLVHDLLALFDMADEQLEYERIYRQTVIAATQLVEQDAPLVGIRPDPVINPDLTVESLRVLMDAGQVPTEPVTPLGLAQARLALQVAVIDPGATEDPAHREANDAPDGQPLQVQVLGGGRLADGPGSCSTLELTDPEVRADLDGAGERRLQVTSPTGSRSWLTLTTDGAVTVQERDIALPPGRSLWLATSLPADTELEFHLLDSAVRLCPGN